MNDTIKIESLQQFEGNSIELVQLWNKNVGSHFPITEQLVERNLLSNRWVDRNNSYLALVDGTLVGFLITKKPLENEQKRVWISSLLVDKDWRKKGIGTQLLHHFEQRLVPETEILIGMDRYHLFPGIPAQLSEAIYFFEKKGYTISGKAYDLRTKISKYKSQYPLEEMYLVRRLREGEQPALFTLLKENFSQRWYDDTLELVDREREIAGTIGLFRGNTLIGFAHVHTFNDGYFGPSVYWKARLEANYGGLGPIGLAKEYQGKGLGTAFFDQIVLLLQKEGIEDMVVDWTILLNYYGKFGFDVWNEYLHGTKVTN
ncbi:GNAT family N-acetyltransferase [Anaerobacillus isosaccharinicus]|uniref:GNAT family N-acetyltransferase n=1 Tax=Anaerobacillus isosaccharinicus TaxID=1532552 RepID=A0A7S7RCN0_9BACI|nr:GNAT family N-acetyltransferase [Anaerobacillus isosaccharinicus]MBA5584484.1 GNAT family N-acetyltransferase [Anaerobacillus isosaccharinicus]QOY37132.1 GNAT family N-acetyltransferase [Anaerobacillus isosaccharinicus]